MIKALPLSTFAIIKIFNNNFFKIGKLSVGDEYRCKTLLPLLFIIEKFNTLRFIGQAFKRQLNIIEAFKLNT
ncbi:hypothetical protein D3C84_1061020 [compost metagenome]